MVGASVDAGVVVVVEAEVDGAVDGVVGVVGGADVGVDEPAGAEVGWSVLGVAVDTVVGAAGAAAGCGSVDEKPDVVGGLGITEDAGPPALDVPASVGAVTGSAAATADAWRGPAAATGDAWRGSAVDPVPHAARTAAMTRTAAVTRRAGRDAAESSRPVLPWFQGCSSEPGSPGRGELPGRWAMPSLTAAFSSTFMLVFDYEQASLALLRTGDGGWSTTKGPTRNGTALVILANEAGPSPFSSSCVKPAGRDAAWTSRYLAPART